CVLEETIVLNGPDRHTLGIEDTTYYICEGQNVTINLGDWRTMLWSSPNGFNSSSNTVVLAQAGNYTVSATDALGCTSEADFKIIYSKDLLKAEFLVPKETYVGDTIVCVNISVPQPDLLVWQFDQSN